MGIFTYHFYLAQVVCIYLYDISPDSKEKIPHYLQIPYTFEMITEKIDKTQTYRQTIEIERNADHKNDHEYFAFEMDVRVNEHILWLVVQIALFFDIFSKK